MRILDVFLYLYRVKEISDMANKENEKILESAQSLERWENTPTSWEDPYSDMSDIEKSKLIQLLIFS